MFEIFRECILHSLAAKVPKIFDKMISHGVIMDCVYHINSLMYHKHFNLKKYLAYRRSWSNGSKYEEIKRRLEDLGHDVIPANALQES